MITEGSENYLRAIYELTHEGGMEAATTSALAEDLGVRAASVTGMLKKLASVCPPLVHYHPYRGASLTPEGLQAALRVVRQHRLLELYLTEALGFRWDQVHAEADRLEHHISQDLGDRIAAVLGDPAVDPHGAPIPPVDGEFTPIPETPLAGLPEGVQARVTRVHDRDPAQLHRLDELGLTPGVSIELVAAGTDGDVLVRLPSGSLQWLEAAIAEVVFTTAEQPITSGGAG